MGDPSSATFVNKVYPEVRGPGEAGSDESFVSAPVDVYLAGTYKMSEAPIYKKLGSFDSTTGTKLSYRCSGNYIHVKFVIPEKSRAEIRGYTLEWSKIGRRS